MTRVLKYAKEYKTYLYLAVIMIFASVISGIIPYFIVNELIVRFLNQSEVTNRYVIFAALSITAFLVLKSILNAIGLTFSHKAAYGTLYEMRKAFSERLEKMPLGMITEKGSGYYKKKIIDDIGGLEVTFAHYFVEGIPNLVIPVVVLLIIFIKDWRMGLLSLGSVPISFITMGLMMKAGLKKMPQYYQSQSRLNNTIIEYIAGMEVIKIFGRTTSSYKKYAEDVEDYTKFAYDWAKSTWWHMSIVGVVLPCTIVLTLPIGMLMYMKGALPLTTLIFTLLLDLGIGLPMNRALLFLPYIPQLGYAITELEKIFDGSTVSTGTIREKPHSYEVSFKQVTFAYQDKEVLKNISFRAHENSLTAIVGPSGGGKSTIGKLLVHYWDVKSGEITIGGRSITEYTSDTLMDMISYVSQDNFLFDDSILQNIRLGKSTATDDEVIRAAKAAACHDFIMKLPNQYETRVGVDGGKLSGGEKQRITIARAILKNAPIVVLDEATAYADAENEDLIQDAIHHLLKGKTIIVIAHRLQSIVNADQILVVDKGRIHSSGTHEELSVSCEQYRRLWTANQAAADWELEV